MLSFVVFMGWIYYMLSSLNQVKETVGGISGGSGGISAQVLFKAGVPTTTPSQVSSSASLNWGFGTTSPIGKFQITKGGSGNHTVSTTTVTLGEVGTTTSKTCFNVKNAAGEDTSFYVSGGALIFESKLCK